jgi:hypothetical protein
MFSHNIIRDFHNKFGMTKYSCLFVDTKLKAKCKLCVTPTILKFSPSLKFNLLKLFESVHEHITPEQTAAAIGSLPLHTAFQEPASFSDQEATTDAIVDMIINLNLPCSIVERPSFRKSYRAASGGNYKPIRRKTVRAKIIQKVDSCTFNYSAYKTKFGTLHDGGYLDIQQTQR